MKEKTAKYNGTQCPWCNFSNLERFTPGMSYTRKKKVRVTVTVQCQDCSARWDEVFSLTGIRNFSQPTMIYERGNETMINRIARSLDLEEKKEVFVLKKRKRKNANKKGV